MPVPLLLVTAFLGLGGAFALNAFRGGDAEAERSLLDRPALPFLTAGEERAAVIRLEETQAAFQREEAERTAAFRSQTLELARRDREAAIQRENAIRIADIQTREGIERRRQEERIQLLQEQARLESEERERARVVQQEGIALDALVKAQAVQASRFQSFARSLPGGFIPVVRPDGSFTALAPGNSLTPSDVQRGLEPLPFQIPTPTAGRITTVPGVFVGAQFRFKTVEEARNFLVESVLKGRASRSRPRGGAVSAFR